MNRSFQAGIVAMVAASGIFALRLGAADKPNFSGEFTLARGKGSSAWRKGGSCALHVVQTESTIEITRVMGGQRSDNRLRLDGTEGAYVNPGEMEGAGLARLKGKHLTIDIAILFHPLDKRPDLFIHTRERWTLSKDLKTLTIRSDVDFPKIPEDLSEAPGFEIYTRE